MPKGISALAGCFTAAHNLTLLDLSFNTIGGPGACAIAHLLTRYPKLLRLDVTSGEIPSSGLQDILGALISANSPIQTLKIGDNELDDKAGVSVANFLRLNRSICSLGLGSRSSFAQFEAFELVKDCRAPLQELVFHGHSLEIEDQCKFLFAGCKQCMDLSSLDVGLIKIHSSKEHMASFFDKPLTFLLTHGLSGSTPAEQSNYLRACHSREKLIKFLIKQRNRPSAAGEQKRRPFVETRDAASAIHGITRICGRGEALEPLLQWRKQIVELMLGADAQRGFSETQLTQLPICNAVLASAKDDQMMLLHNASVRQPKDAWMVGCKEGGNTVLHDAIEMGCSDIACLLVNRNSVVRCEFTQDGEDVTSIYSCMLSADGKIRYDVSPDYVKIDEPSESEGLVPVRAAAARGMWSVVARLRQANCRDLEVKLCEGSAKCRRRTVWHDLATPENPGAGGHEEQLLWAEALREECGHLVREKDDDGRLALHWAARHNHHRLVRLLVELFTEHKIDHMLRERDREHFTPLELAVQHGHTQVVQTLLSSAQQVSNQTNLSITTCYQKADNETAASAATSEAGRAFSVVRSARWLWRHEPRLECLVWPCSPYHLVLLQIWHATSERHSAAGRRRMAALARGDEQRLSVSPSTADMVEMLNTTTEGGKYRRSFLIRHLTQRLLIRRIFMGWYVLLWFMAESVFIGGLFSSSRMELDIQFEEHAYFYNEQFNKNVLQEEFPWEEEAFEKAFPQMQSPDDVWVFVDGVLMDNLFPEEGPPGQVGPFAYLIGSPVLQNNPFTYGSCDGALMRSPLKFKSLGGSSREPCVVGRGDFANDVVLPRSNRSAAIAAVKAIDKDAWARTGGVRISFAIYNTQLQRILLSDLRVEFRPSGLTNPKPKTRVFLWMPINDVLSWMYPFLMCMFFSVHSIFQITSEIRQILSEPNYWESGEQRFDLAVDIVHIVIVVLLGLVSVQQALLANKLDPESDDPVTSAHHAVDFTQIASYSVHLQKVFSSTFLLQTFNLIRILRLLPGIGPQMQAIVQTLMDSKVWQFLVFLLACVMGCAFTVHTMVGADQRSFATVPDAILGMYRFIWSDWDYTDTFSKTNKFGNGSDVFYLYAFFFFVTFLVTGTLANVFIAIVGERYVEHLKSSQLDWKHEVNTIMAKWYGDAFSKRSGYREFMSAAKEFRQSGAELLPVRDACATGKGGRDREGPGEEDEGSGDRGEGDAKGDASMLRLAARIEAMRKEQQGEMKQALELIGAQQKELHQLK
ncbi:unnamed protein product, partial [Prorocentrum cordatum]